MSDSKSTEDAPSWLENIEGEGVPKLIVSTAPLIHVVAGPGSGKTSGLKRRVRRLVEGDGLSVDQIYVGTFTRAIAAELRAELDTEVYVSTLHALAYDLLRSNPAALGGLRLRFLLGHEEGTMLYDINVPHLSNQSERGEALRRQQSARAERLELPDAAFAGEVDHWIRQHGGMLIGEVVHLAVQALESEDIPSGSYHQVIIDEYQDLTVAEQELVERIWSQKGSLVVLGDNDQSIYAFRFNHPEGLSEFLNRWKNAGVESISIPENRRSGTRVVDLANLIMAEAGATKPPMKAESGSEGEVHLIQWRSTEEEIQGLARYIRERPTEKFLVLVPRRFLGHRIRDSIGNEARTGFHQEVLEHQFVQQQFTKAAVLSNPNDRVALRTWLGFHGSKPQHHSTRNKQAYASISGFTGTGIQMLQAIADGSLPVKGNGQTNVKARASAMLEWLNGRGAPETLKDQIDWLFDPALAEALDEAEENKKWIAADLASLRDAAFALVQSGELSLNSIIGNLRYRIATRAPLLDTPDVRVRIMTLHSAKGLQDENVVIAGAADQMIPGFSKDDLREEQRRLFYVGFTRARSRLIVSWPRSIAYDDAKANNVRIDSKSITTVGGTKRVKLTRSSLLPQALGGVQSGATWLARQPRSIS